MVPGKRKGHSEDSWLDRKCTEEFRQPSKSGTAQYKTNKRGLDGNPSIGARMDQSSEEPTCNLGAMQPRMSIHTYIHKYMQQGTQH
eukprot:scaffold196844_cov21-Tisochrysis_lutea.AAC.1